MIKVIEEDTREAKRDELIKFLSLKLYKIIQLKNSIQDPFLRAYYLSSESIGKDLYYLTESYYKQKGFSTCRHNMCDYRTPSAKVLTERIGKSSNNLVFERVVPKNIYIIDFKASVDNNKLTQELIYEKLSKYYYTCAVTVEEDKQRS